MLTARANVALVVVNNKIYAIGGYGYSDYTVTEEYNPDDTSNGFDSNGNPMGKWVSKASFGTYRRSFCTATVNGKIYLIGGAYSNGVLSNAVQEFDPVANSWTDKTAMPMARANLGAVAVGNRIYVIGGMNSTEIHTNIVDEYDPTTESWAAKPTTIYIRSDFGITEHNGSIYLIGGDGGLLCAGGIRDINERYTPTPLTAISDTSQITLRWYTVGGAQSYTVKRASDPGGIYTVVASNLSTTTFTDTGLDMGKPYYYMVYAIYNGMEIVVSNEAWALLGLMAPTNFKVVWETDHYHFSWEGVSKATGYYFKESSTSGGSYTSNYQKYTHTDDSVSGTRYFVVSATNSNGESPNSKELMVTGP